MKHYARFGLPALLVAMLVLAASCGNAGESMRRMGHGSMDVDDVSSKMLMKNGKYSDERFIDLMVPHHQAAVEMAKVVLKNSDNPKIKELAGNIVETQKREISQMNGWREEWYPKG